MSNRTLLVPASSFILAVVLSLVAGPTRAALSRQAAGSTGCQPSCSTTSTDQQSFAASSPTQPADFQGSGEIVDNINAMTGNVGSVTVTANAWEVEIQSSPVGNEGGGGSRLRSTVRVGGIAGGSASIDRVIAYGARALPADHTVNGAASVTVSGLPTCQAANGTNTWSLAAFAVYVAPRGTKRSIGAVASGAGWSCSAQ